MKALKLAWLRTLVGSLMLALALSWGSLQARYLPLRSDVLGDRPESQILYRDNGKIQLEFRLPGLEWTEAELEGRRWDRVEIPGGGSSMIVGDPEVPHYTKLLIIPAGTGLRVEFEAIETRLLPDVNLMPAQGCAPEDLTLRQQAVAYHEEGYSRDAYYPENRVQVGDPALLRGLRVVALQVNPVQYHPVRRELLITTRYRVTVFFEGSDNRSNPTRLIPLSRSWATLIQSQSLNFDAGELDTPLSEALGPYLIVCENDATLLSNLQPLIDWKKRKGHAVVLQTFTPGSTNTSIKNLIQTAYNTWENPPEYVLLFGDTNGDYALPGWPPDGIDHPYAQLDGTDILADIAVGRLPADNSAMSQMMVNKVLLYERVPYTANPDWFHQGVLVAGDNSWINSGLSTVQVNRWIKTRMIWNNYTRIDTLWYWMGGSVATTIDNAINNGVLYCNYRGMQGMGDFDNGDIDDLENGRKQPLVATLTCDTGGFDGSTESFMEHFVSVGTPTTPRGAVCAIGTATTNTHTRFNNTIAMGLFAGIFDQGLTQAGNALNYGKLELYNAYHNNDPYNTENFSLWNALAGDPGLELFTHAIQYLTCSVPDNVTWGVNTLTLTVNQSGGNPLAEATVCLYKAGELQSVGWTDANGQVELPISVATAGNVKVTITKQNYYPLVDSLDVVQSAVAVGYYSHIVDDDNLGGSSGDNDHLLNPGETIELPLIFKNYGSSTTATNVTVTATATDLYASLSDSAETFPNMAPGATGNSLDDFDLTIAPNCPSGHTIRLNLSTQATQGSWAGLLDLDVVSFDIVTRSTGAVGSDTLLSPGETADFVLMVTNAGGKNATGLTATVESLDPYVTVNDNSAAFGTVNVGASVTCSANPFNLTASATAPFGHQADVQVTFSANGAQQVDTLTIVLGNKSSDDPQGPDAYGYYCFDNTDLNYGPAPTYAWVEIDPHLGGSGVALNLSDPSDEQDASVNVNLPFTFRYYGQDVTQITVCSNGWISTVPNVSFTDFRNYPIPSSPGPNGMIAPFWDDLITSLSGRIYTQYDATDHRFILEWSHTLSLSWPNPEETFEIILFDPAYHPTPTGDGEILFQYYSITEVSGPGDDNPYSTVGIESPDQQDGIQVVYWNSYHDPAAATLQNGRAYLFTTDFSYSVPGSDLHVTLAPSGTPIVIPPGGGSFNFTITVGNSSSTPSSADAWCSLTLPSGSSYGPVLGPVIGLPLPGNYSVSRLRTQNVPANAPAGNYVYHAYVGVYPGTIYDQDSFPFSKSGDDGSGDWFTGWENSGEPFETTLPQATGLPQEFSLQTAYPNPFNPTTAISYQLPAASHVSLRVYDTAGRLVVTLVEGEQEAGMHRSEWNAAGLTSGIYFLSLRARDQESGVSYQANQKLVLLK